MISYVISLALISHSPNCDTKEYYSNIWSAESAIMSNDWETGSKLYENAFTVSKPFLWDLKNAIVCEVNAANSTTILKSYICYYFKMAPEEFLENLNSKGKLLRRDSLIFSSFKNERFNDHIDSVKKSPTHPLEKIQKLLIECYARDQHIRDSLSKKTMDFYSVYESVIKRIDYQNYNKLKWVLETEESIHEANIGTEAYRAIQIIIWHNIQWNLYDIYPILKNKVLNGQYDARAYASLYDRLTEHRKDKFIYAQCLANYIENETLFLRKKENARINNEFIDGERKEIFLETYDQLLEKIKWMHTQGKYSEFIFYGFDRFMLPKEYTLRGIEKLSNDPTWEIIKE